MLLLLLLTIIILIIMIMMMMMINTLLPAHREPVFPAAYVIEAFWAIQLGADLHDISSCRLWQHV